MVLFKENEKDLYSQITEIICLIEAIADRDNFSYHYDHLNFIRGGLNESLKASYAQDYLQEHE